MPSHSATAPGEIGQASQNTAFLQDVSVFEQMAAAATRVAVTGEGDAGGAQATKNIRHDEGRMSVHARPL